jgi:hypothetical protein
VSLYDEICCDAELPDFDVLPGSVFQTRSFYYACLQKYRLTKAGRLIDQWGRDLELDGYLILRPAPDGSGALKFRARFAEGRLQNIVRVEDNQKDDRVYGLASYRLMADPSSSSGRFNAPATGGVLDSWVHHKS